MSFFCLDSTKHTYINLEIVKKSDVIFIERCENHCVLKFSIIVNYKILDMLKVRFNTFEDAKKVLDNLIIYFENTESNQSITQEYDKLKNKIDEIYYMPDMPGYINVKNEFENFLHKREKAQVN